MAHVLTDTRSGYQLGGISTALIAMWLFWLLLVTVVMVQAPRLARVVKHPKEEANYDALEKDGLVDLKESVDDNLDAFAIGE
jgi:hypothetical protein